MSCYLGTWHLDGSCLTLHSPLFRARKLRLHHYITRPTTQSVSTSRSSQTHEAVPPVLELVGGPAVPLWLMNTDLVFGGIGAFLAVHALSGAIAFVGPVPGRSSRHCYI